MKAGEMTEYHKCDAAQAMTTNGGNFMKALGHAYLLGDAFNRQKVYTAFQTEFERYYRDFVVPAIEKKLMENQL